MLARSIAFAAALLITPHVALLSAQASTPNGRADYSAQLIVGGTDSSDPAIAWLGLRVRLGAGWHTYWRSPGDAGAAPEFDWSGSRNVAQADVEWPAPRRFSEGGVDTLGYADKVLFPIKVRLRDRSAPAHVSLNLVLYVCSTICTRNELRFEADIAPDAHFAGEQAEIDKWRGKVPRDRSPSITIGSVQLLSGPPAQLHIEAVANPPLTAPDVFIDGDSAVVAGRPRIASGSDGASLITLPIEDEGAASPGQPLRITLVDGNRSVEATLPEIRSSDRRTPTKTGNAGSETASVGSMIAIALLGGLILNFMPCVFPVLSLKLFSLVGSPSQDTRSIRAHFAASGAGVIASFMVLAAVLAALKSVGAQIGWGIQFQQPFFLIGMAAILTAVVANLLGLYEIRLPWRLAGALGHSTGGSTIASHFLNGFVMTLLATPCSAPFVGTAIAFALSQGTPQILEIFAGLGLGMASPYIVLAAIPQVVRLFPRPGRWMLALRPVAAVAMAATAIWLLTVLAQVSGVQTAVFTGALLGFFVWALAVIRRRFAHTIAATLMIALAGTAIVVAEVRPLPPSDLAEQDIRWQPFAPKEIQAMVRSGRTVFVDVGAAWCVTCKVNEALIINSDSIRQRLKSNVTPVKADWTRPDETVAAYLRSFGRYGLPFNVVYGPSAPAGIVLPELLTQEAVLKAFDTAARTNASH